MAKVLWESTRIHIYAGADNKKKSFALIGYDPYERDAVVTLIRGEEKKIPLLLKRFGRFTEEDLKKIQNLKIGKSYWADKYSQITRLT